MFGVWLVLVWGDVGRGFGENVFLGLYVCLQIIYLKQSCEARIIYFFQSALNIFYKKKKKKKKNPEERTGQNI